MLYINASKFLLLLVSALLFGVLPHVVIFALAYGAMGRFSFGIHIESSIGCTIWGLIYYLSSAFLSMHLAFPLGIKLAFMIFCGIAFVLYAPVETVKRPIPKRRRKEYKVKSCLALLVITLTMLSIHRSHAVYSNLLCMAAIWRSINVLPITTHIFRRIEKNEKVERNDL